MTDCDICDDPIDLDTAHYPHDDGCDNIDGTGSCFCTGMAHENCCPCRSGLPG